MGVGDGDGVGAGGAEEGAGLDAVVTGCVPPQPVRIQRESTNKIAMIFTVVMVPPGITVSLLEKKMLL